VTDILIMLAYVVAAVALVMVVAAYIVELTDMRRP